MFFVFTFDPSSGFSACCCSSIPKHCKRARLPLSCVFGLSREQSDFEKGLSHSVVTIYLLAKLLHLSPHPDEVFAPLPLRLVCVGLFALYTLPMPVVAMKLISKAKSFCTRRGPDKQDPFI